MSNVVIRVESLSKQYKIGGVNNRHDTLRDQISYGFKNLFHRNGRSHGQNDTFWALKEVSFEVNQGEVLGVIGRNGAGKSTLLKILSRITDPTSGRAEIHGRVGSLLEVGTGFHGELTGRENIYLNGAILGMKNAEIDRKFDEIVDFSGIETFIDTPVKRYSSGMYVRLAFAVAAQLDPEILIVDEVLAVGDAEFQTRCLGKLGDVAKEGRTILFVSHNMGAITQLCGRALWIKGGQLELSGSPSDVVTSYLTSGATARATWSNPALKMSGDVDFQFTSASVLSMKNEPTAVVDFDKGFRTELGYELSRAIKGLHIVYQVLNSRGEVVWSTFDTDRHGRNNESVWDVRENGRYVSTCLIPGCLLRPGRYTLSIGAATAERRLEIHDNILSFDVSPVGFHFNENRQGAITPLLDWKVTRLN
jgi:homopolymeric O-antigen transport system ATP-binding protein